MSSQPAVSRPSPAADSSNRKSEAERSFLSYVAGVFVGVVGML